MTAPVLVKAYSGTTGNTSTVSSARPAAIQPLPPVSSYAFADILRSADCPEFQHAINGIAEICAKSRLSLADDEGSGKAKKRKTAVGSLWQQGIDDQGTRRMNIGRMGRVITVGGTVALVKYDDLSSQASNDSSPGPADGHEPMAALSRQHTRSDAVTRLRGLLRE
ncbi:hypothetical protein BTJ68_14253 [Hortaea werneckii EXF-2000]|uniref:Uncharacterized protein n=1 Tax=Hortaea werneckii EXF-2000 TaxID=1157616 RepID=A0A1Z5SNZ5_HORWE|nr:hypothetical protein BTJ68_14253 [Hortaea werneckii EXF-2000]